MDLNGAQGESPEPTRWAVNCRLHGLVYLTFHEYMTQMGHPDAKWCCPRCGGTAWWDDENYEREDLNGA